jgi:CheY-specific phosphatase CheX
MPATVSSLPSALKYEPLLMEAMLESVAGAMTMCNTPVRCVGLSTVPAQETGMITGLIGVHGSVSGFVTVNLGERVALAAVGGLVQDEFNALSHAVVDGVGEITNLVVGGIKASLASGPWAFSHITVPSVIIGTGYKINFTKGLTFLCGQFELLNSDALTLADRLFQVNMSLMRL